MREPTQLVTLTLRFEEWLREQLEEAASRSRRSLNAEMVARLEASLGYKDVVLKPGQSGGRPQPTFEGTSTFDFSHDIRELLMWYYMGDLEGKSDHADLAAIIGDLADKVMEAPEAERLKFLGRFLAAKLESREKQKSDAPKPTPEPSKANPLLERKKRLAREQWEARKPQPGGDPNNPLYKRALRKWQSEEPQ